MKEIKQLNKDELEKEINVYAQLVHDIGCFGVRDLLYLTSLEREAECRGYEVKATTLITLVK